MQLLSGKTSATLIANQVFQVGVNFPPTTWADVSAWTVRPLYGVPPQFDLEIWSNSTTNLTAAELFGGSLHPIAIANTDVDDDGGNPAINAGTDTVTITGHPFLTGDGPLRIASSGTQPGGTGATTNYWAIKTGANTIKLATSLALAMAGTPIDITSAGTGTATISDVQGNPAEVDNTQRLHWHSEGLLGVLGDGAVALTSQKAYRERRDHRPRALFYALVATMSAENPEWLSAAAYPVQDA